MHTQPETTLSFLLPSCHRSGVVSLVGVGVGAEVEEGVVSVFAVVYHFLD
jgi:hypothetical protein